MAEQQTLVGVFDAAERTETQRTELAERLEAIGLTAVESRTVMYLWRHPRAAHADGQTAVDRVSQADIAKAIGYSVRYVRDALVNLEAFQIMQSARTGRTKAYLIDWRTVRTMDPVRAAETFDVFAAFRAPEMTPATTALTTAPTPAETPEMNAAMTPEMTTAQQPQNLQRSYPQTQNTTQPQIEGASFAEFDDDHIDLDAEDWGRAVPPAMLRTWDGRNWLFSRALAINHEINASNREDVVGFTAACLCAAERSKPPGTPAGMLLSFVRRRAWAIRGRGGIDGHWISKAEQALREREYGNQ